MNDADVRVELQQLAGELEQAKTEKHRAEIHRLVDKWLDERLDQKGVHKADCSCHECVEHVADILTRRRVAELSDDRGVATEGNW